MSAEWFPSRLRELREQAGLTQLQLAEKAGLTKDGLARLERGTNGPAWDTVLALAGALGVGVEAFTVPPSTEAAPRPRGRPKKDGEQAAPKSKGAQKTTRKRKEK